MIKQSSLTYVSLMRICDCERAKTISNFSIVISEIVGSLDEKVLDGTVDTFTFINKVKSKTQEIL